MESFLGQNTYSLSEYLSPNPTSSAFLGEKKKKQQTSDIEYICLSFFFLSALTALISSLQIAEKLRTMFWFTSVVWKGL